MHLLRCCESLSFLYLGDDYPVARGIQVVNMAYFGSSEMFSAVIFMMVSPTYCLLLLLSLLHALQHFYTVC